MIIHTSVSHKRQMSHDFTHSVSVSWIVVTFTIASLYLAQFGLRMLGFRLYRRNDTTSHISWSDLLCYACL